MRAFLLGLIGLLGVACAASPDDQPASAGLQLLADTDAIIATIDISVVRLSDGQPLYQSGRRPAVVDAATARSELQVSAVLPADTDVLVTADAFDSDGDLLASALPIQIMTPDPGVATTAELTIELED